MTEILADFNTIASFLMWAFVYVIIATNVIGSIGVLTLFGYACWSDDTYIRNHICRTLIKLREGWN